jgi:hypothetical protein
MTTHPHRLNNVLLIVLILLMLAMIVLQVWHMVNSTRPVIRPRLAPTKAPSLPGAWYEKYRDRETMAPCNLLTEQTV